MNAYSILYQTIEDPGYSAAISLDQEELNFFRAAIESQWLFAIEKAYPQHLDKFKQAGIARYHELADLVDHNTLWNKVNRCLPQETVNKIKSFPFFKRLKKEFGEFNISDIAFDDQVKVGFEEIYWRLVRPNVASDVGPLHADKWFHEILHFDEKILEKGSYTIKIWIPIFCEPGKNGLLMSPNSHKRSWAHTMKVVNGLPKPVFQDKAEVSLLETHPGNALIFNEDTLHGGAINKGVKTRVSAEITMVFNPKPLLPLNN